MLAILPSSVFLPVATTTPFALPVITILPEKAIFFRSANGTFLFGKKSANFSTATLSPVSELSSQENSFEFINLIKHKLKSGEAACGNEIEKLFIEPTFQSQGIGAKLLTFAIENCNADWLWVLEYNKRGIEFYKKHGFLLTGEKMMEDEWVPLLKMELAKEKAE